MQFLNRYYLLSSLLSTGAASSKQKRITKDGAQSLAVIAIIRNAVNSVALRWSCVKRWVSRSWCTSIGICWTVNSRACQPRTVVPVMQKHRWLKHDYCSGTLQVNSLNKRFLGRVSLSVTKQRAVSAKFAWRFWPRAWKLASCLFKFINCVAERLELSTSGQWFAPVQRVAPELDSGFILNVAIGVPGGLEFLGRVKTCRM